MLFVLLRAEKGPFRKKATLSNTWLMQEGLGEAGARGSEVEAALQLRASAGLCTGNPCCRLSWGVLGLRV